MPLQDLGAQTFQLPRLFDAISHFEFKANPFHEAADANVKAWFAGYNVYTKAQCDEFFGHEYGTLATWVYPETRTQTQLETTMKYMFWIFSYDDIADESGLKSSEEGLRLAVDISLQALSNPDGPVPVFKFAKMLQE
ncbi:hypothetical protein C8R45DRAFT_946882 [Mycena sanguinolenta]|nr:hypothetical protein C8R45DRAFT_946882 [Mycena sanguinolenta]